MARRNLSIQQILIYGALAYGVYMFLLRAKASGVTVIPPDEPVQLQPPPPVTLQGVRRNGRFYVRR